MQSSSLSFLVLFFLVVFLPFGHGQKEAELTNPIRTYKTALRKLGKGKAVQKQTDLLNQSLLSLINTARERKTSFEAQQELSAKEKALPIYKKILERIDNALPYLDGQFDADKTQLENEHQTLVKTLADSYFENGVKKITEAKAAKDKYLAQSAYRAFQSAKRHQHTSDQLKTLLQESLEFGRILYVVNARAVFEINYNWEIDRQFDDVEAYSNQFLKVSYDTPITSATADCGIAIEFKSLDIDTDENENSEEYKKEVIVGTKTITNSDGEEIEVDKIEEVSATVTTIKITKSAEWEARVSISAITKNCKLRDFAVSDEVVSTITKYENSGDERAVPDHCKSIFPEELKEDDDMAEELISRMYTEVMRRLF